MFLTSLTMGVFIQTHMTGSQLNIRSQIPKEVNGMQPSAIAFVKCHGLKVFLDSVCKILQCHYIDQAYTSLYVRYKSD